jgi:transposase
VRLVLETIEREGGNNFGVITRIVRQLGVGDQSSRNWVAQAEIDRGRRGGTSTADKQRIEQLERPNRERRRANDILKAASLFFTELDGRPKK